MGVRNNKRGHKIADPRRSILASQLTRPSPTTDNISKEKRGKIRKFANNYMKFLDSVRISTEVVEGVYSDVKNKIPNQDFYTNREKTAFGMVKFGQRPISDGVRVFYSHVDAPCLKTKQFPALLEWDPDDQILHTGVELDVLAYGGVNANQWRGRALEIRGHAEINKKRKKIVFPVYSPEISVHTDTRNSDGTDFEESNNEEDLDLVTGYYSVKELVKAIGLKEGRSDFPRSSLYAVPINKSSRIGLDYLVGYGHDNRGGVFLGKQAFLESNPEFTTMFFGFDREEIGSKGSGGAASNFFEDVFYDMLLRSGEVKKNKDLSDMAKRMIFLRSLAFNMDIDVAATNKEIDDSKINKFGISKLGYGAFISCLDGYSEGEQQSPRIIDYVMNNFSENKIVFQTVGSPVKANLSHYSKTMNEFFTNRGIDTINVGYPGGCLHSPEEIIHQGDLYQTYRAYKGLMDSSEKW